MPAHITFRVRARPPELIDQIIALGANVTLTSDAGQGFPFVAFSLSGEPAETDAFLAAAQELAGSRLDQLEIPE